MLHDPPKWAGKAGLCPQCGYSLVKARSPQDHRRFFAVLAKTFENWPHDHEFQPDSSEHLRAWLLCQVGYREAVRIPIPSSDPTDLLLARVVAEGAFKAFNSHSFVRPDGHGLEVYRAKSINFNTLDQKQFAPLREAIELFIQAETGIDTEGCLMETG